MSERESQSQISLPSSAEALFGIIEGSITTEDGKVVVRRTVTPIDLKFMAQEVLVDCTDFTVDQSLAAGQAVSRRRRITPRQVIHSVDDTVDYLSGVAHFAAVHPNAGLSFVARVDFLRRTQHLAHQLFDAAPQNEPTFSSLSARDDFYRHFIGLIAMHTERLAVPGQFQNAMAAQLRVGAAALRAAHIITLSEQYKLNRRIKRALKE